MKHAWLIIAHNEFGILQRLISMVNDKGDDVHESLPPKNYNKSALTPFRK